MRKKIRRTTATRTEPNAETNVPGKTDPNGADGASDVETRPGRCHSDLGIPEFWVPPYPNH